MKKIIDEQPESFEVPGRARVEKALPSLLFQRDRAVPFLAYRAELPVATAPAAPLVEAEASAEKGDAK